MSGEGAFTVQGKVIQVVSARLFRVELANGHRLWAHLSRRDHERAPPCEPGASLTVVISPYDLSKGRVRLARED